MKKKLVMLRKPVYTLLFFSTLFSLNSCQTDEPLTPELGALFTTVRIAFTRETVLTFNARDLEGPGETPRIDTIRLRRGKIYSIDIKFLDETIDTAVVDLTPMIKETPWDYLVCYDVSDNLPQLWAADKDNRNYFLGLKTSIKTPVENTKGTMRITLKYGARKSSRNACLTGETLANAEFFVIVGE